MRDEVRWFAGEMESVLRANDHKGGWDRITLRDLYWHLGEEVQELWGEVMALERNALCKGAPRVIKEAVDVANYAMMIADQARSIDEYRNSKGWG